MKKINIAEQSFNPFDLIGQKGMLISAGTEDKWNTMTASWGAVGVMWGKPSATCYIRKSRFTKGGLILLPKSSGKSWITTGMRTAPATC